MQTIQELRQQLLEISQKLEQLSQSPTFDELNQHTLHHCDVTLADAWHGIDCAIDLLSSSYSPPAIDQN